MQNTIQSLILGLFFTNKHRYEQKTHVVLLGQGWFAKGFLEHINKNKFHVKNITRHEFVNTPMLLKTVNQKNKFIKGDSFTNKIDELTYDEISKINLDEKCVVTKNNNKISWKDGYLVCGLGQNDDIGKKWLPIISKNRCTGIIKKLCIVGAGPTGTELAFYLSDLGHYVDIYDMLDKNMVYNYLSKPGKELIMKKMINSGIECYFGSSYDANMNNKYNEVIFANGSRPNDLMNGWIATSKLNLQNHNDVFFGGDCVHNSTLPRNAQVAYQQGKYVAKTLNGEKMEDFEFDNNGTAIYCGNGDYYVELPKYNKKMVLPSWIVEFYYNFF